MDNIGRVLGILQNAVQNRFMIPKMLACKVVFLRFPNDQEMTAISAIYYAVNGVVTGDEQYQNIGRSLGLSEEETELLHSAGLFAKFDKREYVLLREALLKAVGLSE